MTAPEPDPDPTAADAPPDDEVAPGQEGAVGGPLLAADRIGTAALAVVVVLAALSDSTPVDVIGLVVAAVLFVGGCVGFTIGFLRAAGRSRWEVVDLAGLFYLTGSAPRPVRRAFLGLWFGQIAIAVAAVFVQSPPFAVMAPVWGIGLITWWSGRHGTFPPRPGVARR